MEPGKNARPDALGAFAARISAYAGAEPRVDQIGSRQGNFETSARAERVAHEDVAMSFPASRTCAWVMGSVSRKGSLA